MQKCPKCGYNEGRDWPYMLLILAFGIVSVAAGSLGGKLVNLSIALGMFLFVASLLWKAKREDKNRVEHLKSHPPVAEQPKRA